MGKPYDFGDSRGVRGARRRGTMDGMFRWPVAALALTLLACVPQPQNSDTPPAYPPAQAAHDPSSAAAPTAQAAAAVPTAQGGQKVGLRVLLEAFPRFTAEQIAYQATVLTQNEALLLSTFGAVGSAFYRRACEANPGLIAIVGGAQTNCAQLAQELMQALQFVGQQAVAQNIEIERMKIINSYKCASGEIDRQTCQAYMGAVQAIQQSAAETNQRINDNLGNRCRVGVDPGCVP